MGGYAAFLSMMFFAGFIEFFGGLLVALGFQTSWAAFISSGEMAAAYFMSHAARALFPIQNRGESAVIYCFVFLYIAAHGSGALSLDSIFGKKTKTPKNKNLSPHRTPSGERSLVVGERVTGD